jgi:hypothetical protein
MSFKGGEFSTGTTGNFQPELTLCLRNHSGYGETSRTEVENWCCL